MGEFEAVLFVAVLFCAASTGSAQNANYGPEQSGQPYGGRAGEKTYTLVTYTVADENGQQRQVQKLINLQPGDTLTGQCEVQPMGQTVGGVGIVGVGGGGSGGVRETVSTSVRTERRCYKVLKNPDGSVRSKTPVECPPALGAQSSGQQYPVSQVAQSAAQMGVGIQYGQQQYGYVPQQQQIQQSQNSYGYGSQRSANGPKSAGSRSLKSGNMAPPVTTQKPQGPHEQEDDFDNGESPGNQTPPMTPQGPHSQDDDHEHGDLPVQQLDATQPPLPPIDAVEED